MAKFFLKWLFLFFFLFFFNFPLAFAKVDMTDLRQYAAGIENIQGALSSQIYLIVDDQDNVAASINAAKIIEKLVDVSQLKFVAVEGFEGNIDTSVFKSFPKKELRQTVADLFLSRGIISAAEYVSVVSDNFFMLYGIENQDYYREFLHQYQTQKVNDLAQDVKNIEYSEYFLKRRQGLVDNFIYQCKTKGIVDAVVVIHNENLKNFVQRFKEDNLSFSIIFPRKDSEGQKKISSHLDNDPTLQLLRDQPVVASLFEYTQFRIPFLNDYIAKLLMVAYLSGESIADIKKGWAKALTQLIERKKVFYQEFFVSPEKEILSEEIFSLFNVLDTQSGEFDGLLADIEVHKFINIYADEVAKLDEFIIPITYYNSKKTVMYCFFKDISFFSQLLTKDKDNYVIKNLQYAVLELSDFFDFFISHQKQFLLSTDEVTKLKQLSSWTFLTLMQKQYLLIKDIISLEKVFQELGLLMDNLADYGDEKGFKFEEAVVNTVVALAEFCIVDINKNNFLTDLSDQGVEKVEESLKISLISYFEVLRLGNKNKGMLDLIVGDIFYEYKDSLKEAIYGELKVTQLQKIITLKSKLLCDDLLKENDVFGIIENISSSLYGRLKNQGDIWMGKEGIVSAEDSEYDLTKNGIEANEEFFLKRLNSYTAAIGRDLKDFLNDFDFSRIEFKRLNSPDKISFVLALAYLQNKIKSINILNESFQLLIENSSTELSQLLFDVDVLQDGFIDNVLMSGFLSNSKKMFAFSANRELPEVVAQKLVIGGMLDNELDNEIKRMISVVDLERYFSSKIAVITNTEDIIKKALLDVSIRKEISTQDVFLFLAQGKVDIATLSQFSARQVFIVPRGTLLVQLLSEIYAKYGGLGRKELYNRAGYTSSEIRYLLQKNEILVREPRTKFLLNLFVRLKDKIVSET